jgi:uncharacterized protein (TIGR02246 family)
MKFRSFYFLFVFVLFFALLTFCGTKQEEREIVQVREKIAHTPEDAHREWVKAFEAGDLEGLVALYEPDAVVMSAPGGELVSGDAALRENLQGYLALGAEMDLRVQRCLQSGDIAILYSRWTLTGGTGPDGTEVNLAGQTTDVVRRQADGTWLLVIDNPFGCQGID